MFSHPLRWLISPPFAGRKATWARSAARALLARLPEEMTLYERKLAGYVRMRLGRPRLVLAEDLGAGLGAGERRRAAGFAAAYLADCPEGTFIQLEDVPDESG